MNDRMLKCQMSWGVCKTNVLCMHVYHYVYPDVILKKFIMIENGFIVNTDPPASGSTENLDLASLVLESGWKDLLKNEFKKDYFKTMEKTISQEKNEGKLVFPPDHLIFNAFNTTPVKKVSER